MTRPIQKVLSFLNTSLGIWFLSSVVLGGLSFGYSLTSKYLEEQSKRNEQILRLRLEVAIRVQSLRSAAEIIEAQDPSPEDDQTTNSRDLLALALRAISGPPNVPLESLDGWAVPSVFPEYKDRRASSLIYELLIIETSEETRDAVGALLEWIESIRDHTSPTKSWKDMEVSLKKAYIDKYWSREPGEKYVAENQAAPEAPTIAPPAAPPAQVPNTPAESSTR